MNKFVCGLLIIAIFSAHNNYVIKCEQVVQEQTDTYLKALAHSNGNSQS